MDLKYSRGFKEKLNKVRDVNYFKEAGDLDSNVGYINDYVCSNTSGVMYDDCYLDTEVICSFEQFVSYVEDGYNVVSAEVLGEDKICCHIQKIDREKGRGR